MFDACEIAQFPQEKYLQYESDMMTLRDYEHDLYFSRKEGFEEGEAKGRAEGKAEGLLHAAKSMRSEGIPLETIIRITGLTKEVITEL